MTNGPSWLGIGAQRSGTTWFTNLLTQHPQVSLAAAGSKELHQLYLPFHRKWDVNDIRQYRDHFEGEAMSGEFTPYYLRAPWVPAIAAATIRANAPIIVLLRDPVERYESAIRLAIKQRPFGDDSSRLVRYASSDATWAGMYATQLEPWVKQFGRRRLLVFQYEQVRQDPAPSIHKVWQHLHLSPVKLTSVEKVSRTTASEVDWSLDQVPGLRSFLVRLYGPEVRSLRGWGFDLSLWPNFGDQTRKLRRLTRRNRPTHP